MPKVSTSTKNGHKPSALESAAVQEEEDMQSDGESRGSRGGLNPYMLRLTPEMIATPHLLELKRGGTVDSFEFALAKLDNLIAKPLGFNSEEEWLLFARRLFPYRQRQEELRAEEQANKILEDLKDNPVMLQRVAQLAAQLSAAQQSLAGQSGVTPPLPSVFPEDYGQPTPLEMARFS